MTYPLLYLFLERLQRVKCMGFRIKNSEWDLIHVPLSFTASMTLGQLGSLWPHFLQQLQKDIKTYFLEK